MHRIDLLVDLAGNKKVVDVTVRHPKDGYKECGDEAAAGEKFKVKFIQDRYHISKEHIIPFSIEAYGVLGNKAKEFLRAVAKFKTGDDKGAYSSILRFYRARIAVAVQRGNVIAINRWRARCGAAAAAVGA